MLSTPMYVDLREVPKLKNAAQQAQFDKEFRELNALPQVEYDRVNKLKRDYLLLHQRKPERVAQDERVYRFLGQQRTLVASLCSFLLSS